MQLSKVKSTTSQSKQPGQNIPNQSQMMQKMFEFENEVIEEELYHFSEAAVDRMMEERPWLKE